MLIGHTRRSFCILVLALVLGGCAGRAGPDGSLPGAPAAPASVERFLQLSAAQDYAAMGWLFGTAEGPIMARDPLPEVEQRMYALSRILAHDGFVVGSGTPVPGRSEQAILFDVIINRGLETFRVPFTAVLGEDRRWYVEQVGVEAITGR